MQPVPAYSEEDLTRVVTRDFAAAQVPAVLRLLDDYGGEEWHREVLRVRLACLKLARADFERLRAAVGVAVVDYRDVLAAAEYPRYLRARDADARARAIERDWLELKAWLGRR